MDSESDSSRSPSHPYHMTIEELSLLSSPFLLTPPQPDPIDPNLLQKLGLTTDELGETVPKEEPKTQETSKEDPESESDESLPEVHIQRVPIISFSTDASEDIIYDFNKENMSFQKYEKTAAKVKVPKPCPECYRYLIEHQDYPFDDYEELHVSVRSPSGNKQKIVQQLKDLQKDILRFEESTPADAGIPVTTPRRSPYPKRPMSLSVERESDPNFLPMPQSTPRCPYYSKNRTQTSSLRTPNYNFQKPNMYFVSTPQGFPSTMINKIVEEKSVGTSAKHLKSFYSQNKPFARYPVMDLRKTYDFKYFSKKPQSVNRSHSKRPLTPMVYFKDKEIENLTQELKTISFNFPIHQVASKVIEKKITDELECDIYTTPQTIIDVEEYNQKLAQRPSCRLIHKNIQHTSDVLLKEQTSHSQFLLNHDKLLSKTMLQKYEENTLNKLKINADTLTSIKSNTLISFFKKDTWKLEEVTSSSSSFSDQTVVMTSIRFRETQTPNSSILTKITEYKSKVLLKFPDNYISSQNIVDENNTANKSNSNLKQLQSSIQLHGSQSCQVYNLNEGEIYDQTFSTKPVPTSKTIDEKQCDAKIFEQTKGFCDIEIIPECRSKSNIVPCLDSNEILDNYKIPASSFIIEQIDQPMDLEKNQQFKCDIREFNKAQDYLIMPLLSKAENNVNTTEALQRFILAKNKEDKSTSCGDFSIFDSLFYSDYNCNKNFEDLNKNLGVKRLWSPNRGKRSFQKILRQSAIPRFIESNKCRYLRFKPLSFNYNNPSQKNLNLTINTHRLNESHSSVISLTPILNQRNSNLWKCSPKWFVSNYSQTLESKFLPQSTTINSFTSTFSRVQLEKQKNVPPNRVSSKENRQNNSCSLKEYKSVQHQVTSPIQSKSFEKSSLFKKAERELVLVRSKYLHNFRQKEELEKNILEKFNGSSSSSSKKLKTTKYCIMSTTPGKSSLLGHTIKFREY